MVRLGELLALLHTADSRYRTLRVVERDWIHHERWMRAFERHAEQARGYGVSMSRYGGCGEPAETSVTLTRLWVDGTRRRQEHEHAGAPGHTSVDDGATRRGLMPGAGDGWLFYESPSEPGQPGSLSVDPSALVGGYDFRVLGEAEFLGRPVLRVEAVERHGPGGPLGAALPHGADRHELLIDAERGVVLRAESLLDGEPLRIHEVVEIAFDEPIDEERFRLEIPAGARNVEDLHQRARDLTVEEAAALVPFPVLVPERLPGRWQPMTCIATTSDELGAAVFLHYSVGFDGQLSITQHAAGGGFEPGGGEATSHGGRSMRVGREGGQDWVALEHAGTHALLRGNLGRDELLAVAVSLVVAPDEPPRLSGCEPE